MPTPPTVFEDFNFTNWSELLGPVQPGGAMVFSETQQTAGLVALLKKPLQKNSFMRRVRGYSYADAASPWRLRRVNPMAHPEIDFRYLRCTQVGFEDFQPAGNPANTNKQPFREIVDTTIDVDSWGYYAASKATLSFAALPYPVIEDDDYTQAWYVYEYDRNVDFYDQTSADIQIISAQTNSAILFAEGGTSCDPKGKPLGNEIGEYIPKMKLQWKWYNVPHEYVFDANDVPTKILKGLGRVNASTFRGYPKMTLLLAGVGFERFLNPWQWQGYRPSYSYNVTFVVDFFDPDPAVASPLFRGHNLLPWTKTTASTGNIWYSVTRTPAVGGLATPYIPHYEFENLFRHAQDTTVAPPAYPAYPTLPTC